MRFGCSAATRARSSRKEPRSPVRPLALRARGESQKCHLVRVRVRAGVRVGVF